MPDSPNINPGAVQQPAPPSPQVVSTSSSSKMKLLKPLLIVIGMVLLIGILVFAGWQVYQRFGKGGGTELTWWGLWEDDQVVLPLIDEYQKINPNVTIKYVKQSKEDYRERLTNSLAKGTGPDIFRFHNSWVPMFKKDLDQLPSSVMSASEFAKTFYPVVTNDLTSGTGLVGIPLEYDGLSLFINEDIFNQAGKSPPATWDDLRQTALELTRKDDQGVIIQSGAALGLTENVDHWPEILALMMLQNGVDLSEPSGQLAEDALTFYTIFTTSDGVWDRTLPASTIAFASGNVAMYFGPSWRAFNFLEQNPNLKFKAVPVPQLPKTSPSDPNVTYASYWIEGVWARSSNKKAAWDFLKFLSSKESLEKLYQNSAKTRPFGEPYPRIDMAELLTNAPYVGAVVSQAPDAQSWYLASRTFDGPTGINSQINKYFEDAINALNSGTPATKALEPVVAGVSQVLSQYGLVGQ